MSKGFASVFIFLVASLSYAAVDRCNDILIEQGAFNTIVKTSSYSADEQVFEWLKTVTWEEFRQVQDAGLKIVLPVDGATIPVGVDGKYSEQQFRLFVERRDQGKLRFFRVEEFNSTLERTASEVIAKRWGDCMRDRANLDPHGLTCRLEENDEQENGVVVFKARYYPDEPNATEPTTDDGGLTVTGGTIVNSPNPLRPSQPVRVGGTSVTVRREGRQAITLTLNTTKGSCPSITAPALPAQVVVPPRPVHLVLVPVLSAASVHPTASAGVPAGYKLIAGGALSNWRGAGSLLIASYPNGNTWTAQSKDHLYADASKIMVWAIGLYDPRDEWDVKIVSSTASYTPSARLSVTAQLPAGYAMTGGGAASSPENPGILLTGSFPSSLSAWQANAQDHTSSASGQLSAFVIGIRSRAGETPRSRIFQSVSASAAHPASAVRVDDGYVLTGGGAATACPAKGNLLTASYPFDNFTWRGEAKDHSEHCESTITVYAVGLKPANGSSFGTEATAVFSVPSFLGRYALSHGMVAPRSESAEASTRVRYYVARKGDTLRGLAMHFYENGDWRPILEANRDVVRDPNLLTPGSLINIP